MVVLLIIVALLFPVFAQHRNGRDPALSNIKQLALGNLMYAADNDDRLPVAERWMDVLVPHLNGEQLFVDPDLKDRQEDEYGYAFFRPLSGASIGAVVEPGTVPLLFQSSLLHRNATSDLTTRPKTSNGRRLNVAFLDGHAKYMQPEWPESPIVLSFRPVSDEEGPDEETAN
ncbi:MAG: hypothetical protein IH945_08770 [Armatimonadetes bacterium]|nr:hypothetical protein [Armatimonadota bacterium]